RSLEEASAREHDGAVHEARKSVKKVRAALRLVKAQLDTFARDERHLRKAGRKLSRTRDAVAAVDAYDKVRSRYRLRLRGAVFAEVRRRLAGAARKTRKQARSADCARRAAKELRQVRRDVKKWNLRGRKLRTLRPGLEKAFRKARRALTLARRQPTAVHFHDWRKRIKRHWYHLRLLQSVSPSSMRSYADRL